MPQCSAINCSNRPEKGFKLFRFPAEVTRRRKWVKYCGRKDFVPTNNSALCELHFAKDQFRTDLTEDVKKLYPDAIPSVHVQSRPRLPTSKGKKKCKSSSHTQNLVTEEPKKKEDAKPKACNVDTPQPSVKKLTEEPKKKEDAKPKACNVDTPQPSVKKLTEEPKKKEDAKLKACNVDTLQPSVKKLTEEPKKKEDAKLKACNVDTPQPSVKKLTKEPKKRERAELKACNVDTPQPSVKKTKRWTHLPKVDWSYDHLYSKRRRIYFEIVESRLLTGKSDGKCEDKVEGATNEDAEFSNGVQSEHDWNIKDLRDAIDDAVQAKTELQKQLMDLSDMLKEKTEHQDRGNVEAVRDDLQDDLEVVDLHMTVEEVNDGGHVADGCGYVETQAKAELTKQLEDLELLEKALKTRLTKKLDAEKVPSEEIHPAVDELCQTETKVAGECTKAEGSGKVFRENPIDSGVEIGDAQDACKKGLQTNAMSALTAVENERGTESSAEASSSSGFVCESCGKMFPSFYQMHSHQRLHVERKRRPRICSICHKSFLLLGRHLRTHSGERPYRCLHCARQFSRLDNLQNHLRSHANRAGKRHACDQCGAEFPDDHEFRLHQRTHRGETLYSCAHCDRQFLYRNVWKSHVKSHLRRKQFLCNVCGKQFVQANNLNDHIASVHSNERSHECHVCGKRFVRASSLRLHANAHTGNRPHPCGRCTKRFFTRGGLAAHVRIHYGETPFVCGVCWKCFRYSCHLKIHMRVHTGERPYQCVICSKCFAQNGNLKEHMRMHLQTSSTHEET